MEKKGQHSEWNALRNLSFREFGEVMEEFSSILMEKLLPGCIRLKENLEGSSVACDRNVGYWPILKYSLPPSPPAN